MLTEVDLENLNTLIKRAARDPWESDYRKIWRAAYGASFAIMVRDHMMEGRGAPTDEDVERFCEESGAVAALAAQASTDADNKAAEKGGGK